MLKLLVVHSQGCKSSFWFGDSVSTKRSCDEDLVSILGGDVEEVGALKVEFKWELLKSYDITS